MGHGWFGGVRVNSGEGIGQFSSLQILLPFAQPNIPFACPWNYTSKIAGIGSRRPINGHVTYGEVNYIKKIFLLISPRSSVNHQYPQTHHST